MAFSQRLCASAGDGLRYCAVEFLFIRGARVAAIGGAGGMGRVRFRSWGDFPAETQRRGEDFIEFHFQINGKSFAQLQVAV